MLAGEHDRVQLPTVSPPGLSPVLHWALRHRLLLQLPGRLLLPALHSPPEPEIHGRKVVSVLEDFILEVNILNGNIPHKKGKVSFILSVSGHFSPPKSSFPPNPPPLPPFVL